MLENDTNDQMKNKIKNAKLSHNIKNLVVTLGGEGSIAATNEEVIFSPAFKVDVIDITGAGDAFISALVYSYLKNSQISKKTLFDNKIEIDNIQFANYASAKVVSQKGTLPIDKEFILNNKPFLKKKKIVGFTNGCFDILHSGHISLFEEAKKNCDYLIVALNSDNSVRRLKGETRPINDQSSRLNLLKSLKWIDEVLIFDEDTPEKLIKNIKPDVLIKGSDYKLEEIIGADFVKSYGGRIIRANFIKNKSSSKLIEDIKNL